MENILTCKRKGICTKSHFAPDPIDQNNPHMACTCQFPLLLFLTHVAGKGQSGTNYNIMHDYGTNYNIVHDYGTKWTLECKKRFGGYFRGLIVFWPIIRNKIKYLISQRNVGLN